MKMINKRLLGWLPFPRPMKHRLLGTPALPAPANCGRLRLSLRVSLIEENHQRWSFRELQSEQQLAIKRGCQFSTKNHHSERSKQAVVDPRTVARPHSLSIAIKEAAQLASNQSKGSRTMAAVSRKSMDQKLALAKRCSHEGVVAGVKAAVVATVASAVPTLASVRMLPWAKANLNPTAQALIVSTAAGMAYFIVADRTILKSARRNSFADQYPHISA